MAGKRLLALLAAVALVAGAFVLRARIDDDPPSSSGPSTTAPDSGDDEALRLLCLAELEELCVDLTRRHPEIELLIEDLGASLDRFADSSQPADVDGWLTFDPLDDLVVERQQRAQQAPTIDSASDPLAASPLVLVGFRERIDALVASCDGELTWRCLGEIAGRAWGDVGGSSSWGAIEPGHESPVETASGLLVLGQAVVSYFGTTNLSANIELADGSFRSWLRNLERSVPDFGTAVVDPLGLLLTRGAAMYDAVGAIDAIARPTVERSAKRDDLVILTPTPLATATIVLASGSPAGDDLRALIESDVAEWGDQPPAAGTGLPSGGVLDALASLWREVTR